MSSLELPRKMCVRAIGVVLNTHTRSHPLLNILTKKKFVQQIQSWEDKKSACFHLFQHIVCISSCWMCTCEPPPRHLAATQSVPPLQSVAAAVEMIVSWNSSTEISGDSDLRCKDLPPAPAGWDLAERQLDYSLSLHMGHLAECEGGGGCLCVCVFRSKIWTQNQHLFAVCFVYFRSCSETLPWQKLSKKSPKPSMNQ